MNSRQELNSKGLEVYRCFTCTCLFVDYTDKPFVTCNNCYKVIDNKALTEEII